MSVFVAWDKYETALLIEAYWLTKNDAAKKADILKKLSNALREYGKRNGVAIDDTYRNINGMQWQMGLIDAIFQQKNSASKAARVFIETCEFYKADYSAFMSLLDEAHKKIAELQNDSVSSINRGRNAFVTYLSVTKVNGDKAQQVLSAIDAASVFGTKKKMFSCDFYSFRDVPSLKTALSQILSNGVFKFLNRQKCAIIRDNTDLLISFYNSDPVLVAESDHVAPRTAISKPDNHLKQLLLQHFSFGIRPDSIRELLRLRSFAEEEGVLLPANDDELKNSLMRLGILMDGLLLVFSDKEIESVVSLLSETFSSEQRLFFFESLYDNNETFLNSVRITSAASLRLITSKYISGLYLGRNFAYLGPKMPENEVVDSELMRIWGDTPVLTIESLHLMLPYVPERLIRNRLSANKAFIRVADGEYFYLANFVIDEEEMDAVKDFVKDCVAKTGYASLNDIPLGDLEEKNYKIPVLVIQGAVYQLVLSSAYQNNNQILTPINQKAFSTVSLLIDFCSSQEFCLLDDIRAKVVELTGKSNGQYAFEALYSSMVRVDEQKFVNPSSISFDVPAIDALLEGSFNGDAIPIKSISSFALFPACGAAWNAFVLESYCYRFSEAFIYRALNFNSKNAGVITRRDDTRGLEEILVDVIAKSGISINTEEVGKYLFEQGYMARSKYGNLESITERAKAKRKGVQV